MALKNTNTLMADNGTNKKKYTPGPVYGSNYGGAAATGKTGSSLGLYGSQYNGASTNPKTTTTTTIKNPVTNRDYENYVLGPSSDYPLKPGGGDKGGDKGGDYVSGGGYSSGGGGGGGGSSYNPMSEFESVWNKYYAAAKAAADVQRDKDLAELENEWERARNRRNVQYLNDAKSMSRLYGARDPQYGGNYGGDAKRGGQGSFGSMYGGGWTNQLANKLGWRSDNADLLANRNTNANNVRTNYSNYLANLELQKLNNWSNVMAPYYMNQSFLG